MSMDKQVTNEAGKTVTLNAWQQHAESVGYRSMDEQQRFSHVAECALCTNRLFSVFQS